MFWHQLRLGGCISAVKPLSDENIPCGPRSYFIKVITQFRGGEKGVCLASLIIRLSLRFVTFLGRPDRCLSLDEKPAFSFWITCCIRHLKYSFVSKCCPIYSWICTFRSLGLELLERFEANQSCISWLDIEISASKSENIFWIKWCFSMLWKIFWRKLLRK